MSFFLQAWEAKLWIGNSLNSVWKAYESPATCAVERNILISFYKGNIFFLLWVGKCCGCLHCFILETLYTDCMLKCLKLNSFLLLPISPKFDHFLSVLSDEAMFVMSVPVNGVFWSTSDIIIIFKFGNLKFKKYH